MNNKIDTDVLVVGGGAAGLTASILLSRYGVNSLLVSKYPGTSNLPKAHVISIKSMEIFRELGVEEEIRKISTPDANMRYAGYYAGLAGSHEDYGRAIVRIGAWGRGGLDLDWAAASSVGGTNLMQSRLEPILKRRLEELAPKKVRFNHNLLALSETSDGVVSSVEDRTTGETYEVHSRYVLACDGGRTVGPQLGIELQGHMAVATSISIHFSADLSQWARDPEALTCAILNPDHGVPCTLVPMGRDLWGNKATEWVVHLVSFAGDHKTFDDETAVKTMLRNLGLPDLNPKVHIVSRWPLDAVVASRFRVGRAFVLGDAAHRMPPTGGHGMNSAIQDAYNLCWKLAAVLKGGAGVELLDTYEEERRPFAQHVVQTAFKGWQQNKEFAAAVGFSPQNTAEENWRNIRDVWREGPVGNTARRRVARSLPGILPNFNSLNVGFGYTYDEGALVPDGTLKQGSSDPLAIYVPSTRPGHSVPHAWVEDLLGRMAIGDLVADGRFTLIAGEDGPAWCEAARAVAAERGIACNAFTVGTTEGDWLDMRHGWSRVREFGPTGAILVRPDRFVAWRSMATQADVLGVLRAAFSQILH